MRNYIKLVVCWRQEKKINKGDGRHMWPRKFFYILFRTTLLWRLFVWFAFRWLSCSHSLKGKNTSYSLCKTKQQIKQKCWLEFQVEKLHFYPIFYFPPGACSAFSVCVILQLHLSYDAKISIQSEGEFSGAYLVCFFTFSNCNGVTLKI